MEATFECVIERGYAATTTTEIVRRAGVSRGAQVHHFRTKADLLLAAVQWMFERRFEEFSVSFGTLRPEERTLERAVELLWDQYRRPEFIGWLELAVVCRTDPVLGARFRELSEWFDAESMRLFRDHIQVAGDDSAFAELAIALSFAALDGAGMSRALGIAGSGDKAVEALKLLAVLFDAPAEGG